MSDLDDYESIGEDLWRLFTKPGQTVEKTKQRKFAWFDGAYQIMLETMPLHPLTHILGDMVRAYQKISIDTIALSPSETRV
jgi:S-ribosylhomocysteine lyase LuxS involved in autoinducer biosynthesis